MPDFPAFPPPGELIDIGTHRMHIYSLGEGTPAVVMDAGSGDNVLTWDQVQTEIARFTRVIAYDRSGLGWSERGPNPRSGETIVEELHALLMAAQISMPVILVGHSIGGIHVRMFAHSYPDFVAGLLLIDGAHENQAERMGESDDPDELITQHLKRLCQMASFEEVLTQLLGEYGPAFFDLPEPQQMRLERMRPEYLKYVLEEKETSDFDLIRRGDQALNHLGDIPLIVLTATEVMAPPQFEDIARKRQKIFQDCQTEIAGLSTNGRQIFVDNARHYIHRSQPQAVIDAVRELVQTARKAQVD